jgi:hypothetical protein
VRRSVSFSLSLALRNTVGLKLVDSPRPTQRPAGPWRIVRQPGPAIAGGMMFVSSGYARAGGIPGNVLLAFSIDGK